MLGAGVPATDSLGVFIPRAITLPTPSELGFVLRLLWFVELSNIQVASIGHLPIDLLAIPRALPRLRLAKVCGCFPGLQASPRQKTSPSGRASPPTFSVKTNCAPGTCRSSPNTRVPAIAHYRPQLSARVVADRTSSRISRPTRRRCDRSWWASRVSGMGARPSA